MENTAINEQGNQYGRLTVISKAQPFKKGDKCLAQWNCICECGIQCVVIGADLRNGHRKSCGCLKREKSLINCLNSANDRKGKPAENLVNEIGNRYGRLLVTESIPSRHRKSRWICLCDCGKTKRATGDSLRSGKVSSCGCLRRTIANDQRTSVSTRFSQYKSNAKHRKLEFLLDIEQFSNIVSLDCKYCNGSGGGVDRWDNSIGYTIDNAVPCCTICNRMKLTLSHQEFIVHILKIAENHKNNNTVGADSSRS